MSYQKLTSKEYEHCVRMIDRWFDFQQAKADDKRKHIENGIQQAIKDFNKIQQNPSLHGVHAYTCPNDHCADRVLVMDEATIMCCPSCSYTQTRPDEWRRYVSNALRWNQEWNEVKK